MSEGQHQQEEDEDHKQQGEDEGGREMSRDQHDIRHGHPLKRRATYPDHHDAPPLVRVDVEHDHGKHSHGAGAMPDLSADDQVTFIVRHHVSPDKVDEYQAFQQHIAKVAETFPGCLAHTVLPPEGRSGSKKIFLVMIKFASRQDFQRWINSDIRAQLLQGAAAEGLFEEIDWDLKEGTLTIVDQGLMDDYVDEEEAQAAAARLAASQEPPKWKFAVLVVGVLFLVQMFGKVTYKQWLLTTPLANHELAFYLINLTISVFFVSYVGLPIASRLLRPLMRPRKILPRRLSWVAKAEPFRSLTHGLPCFRAHHEPNTTAQAEMRRHIRTLESTIDRMVDKNLKLQDRLDRLETALLPKSKRLRAGSLSSSSPLFNGPGASPPGCQMERGESDDEESGIPLLPLPSPLSPPPPPKKAEMVRHISRTLSDPLDMTRALLRSSMNDGGVWDGEKDIVEEALNKACEDAFSPDSQVTMVVTVHVGPAYYDRFEDFIRQITKCARLVPGYYGAHLLRPTRGSCVFVVLHRFKTVASARAFTQCPKRKALVERILPSLVLQPPTVRIEVEKTVLGELFRKTGPDPLLRRNGKGPQRWKMLVVLDVAVTVVQYPLLHWDAYCHMVLRHVPTLVGNLISNFIVVGVLVYVTLPLTLLLLGRWVFAPWKESKCIPLRLLQNGFPCL